jgi:O-antigen/teichoic acid export membrane protein
VPLFCAAQAHRNIIVGTGRFRERAYVSAARWVARLLLVVVFVEVSGSPLGALLGSVCASLVELIACRRYARPHLFKRGAYPARRLCRYALPLVASALCVSLYNRLDLMMLKALGGTNAEAGVYGVAQNLALLPSLFSFSLAPALLSTLSRALRDGDERAARETGRQAMRAVFLLLPFAALAAGAAPEIVRTIFGTEFLAAVPLVRLLIFGALALLLLALTTSVLTAAGKPRWTLHLAWPLLLGAAAGHLLLIPRARTLGAAFVTTALACASALVSVGLVRRLWHITPPAGTLWRSTLISLAVYALAALPTTQVLMLIPKLAGASLFVPLAFVLLREFSAEELRGARAMLLGRPRTSLEAP